MNQNKVWAVLGSFAALAVASTVQAQSSVEIYGIADAAVEVAKNGDGLRVTRLVSGQGSASRLGFRGTEDLGGGLKAHFNMENGFNIDSGAFGDTTRLFQRRATVGMSGPWGRVDLGRQYRVETRILFAMDPFDSGSIASPSNTLSTTVFRSDNAIVYETPNFNGLVGRLMYAFGEGTGALKGANDDVGATIQYNNGPLYVAYGYDARENATNTDTRKIHTLGGAYNFGPAKLYAAYRTREEAAAGLDENNYWLGVSVPVRQWTFSAAVTRVNGKTAANRDANGLGLGVDYDLSKRTTFYGRYGKIENKNGSTFNLDNGINGSEPVALAVGVRHKF